MENHYDAANRQSSSSDRFYLDGSEGAVLAGTNAFSDGGKTARDALERQQKRRLIFVEHVTVHVAVASRQQIHFLHRIHFELVESRFRSLHLRLNLTSVTDSYRALI